MNVLVLARIDEDVSWVRVHGVPGWQLHVVQKEDDVTNDGHEQSSYLWWIIKHWARLDTFDTVCFSQAWPWDHVPDFEVRDVDRFTPMGRVAQTVMSEPHDQFVRMEWERLLRRTWPGVVDFPSGSCFLVPGRTVQRRPLGFYVDLLDYVTQTPVFHAHVVERLWPGILE